MADRTVSVRLEAITGPYQAALTQASQGTKKLKNELSQLGRMNEQTARQFQTVGRAGVVMGAGLAAGVAVAVKAAVSWESSWAGVTKTVDGSTRQMADLEAGLRGLARELPSTHAEIAGVAEAAGALGIEAAAIESFTRTMIDLGETTNVTADVAATSLARIANIMGTASDDFDRLGSTLVDLGNNGASTEAEILELSTRLAAAGQIAGLSESNVFAFASTLASVGVEAEAGGTALSKVFTGIRDAVLDGGDKLETFASVAGTTTEQFRQSFGQDASGAIASFVEGLGRINESGQSTTGVFESLELTDQRLMRALLSTAGAGELLTEQLNLGAEAWDENSALAEEAEKRYATTGAQLEILRNNAVDLAIGFGDTLLPAIRSVVDVSSDLLDGFRDMPSELKSVAAGLGVVTGGLAGLGGAAVLLGPKLAEFRLFAQQFPMLTTAFKLAAPPLLAVGAAAVLTGKAMGDAEKRAAGLVEELTGDLDVNQEGSLVANLRQVREELAALEAEQSKGAGPKAGSFWSDLAGGIRGAVDSLPFLNTGFHDTNAAISALTEEEGRLLSIQHNLTENFGQMRLTMGLSEEEAERLAETAGVDLTQGWHTVQGALKSAYDEMTAGLSPTERTTLSLEEQEDAAKALKEKYEALAEGLGEFTSGLGAWDAVIAKNTEVAQSTADATESSEDSWRDFYDGVSVTTSDLIAELERQVTAQNQWSANLGKIAARGRLDVATELAKLGPEGAGLVAQFADMTNEEFQRAGDLYVRSVADDAAGAGEALDVGLKVMAAIARAGGQATVQSIASELGLAEEVVRSAAARMNAALPDEMTVKFGVEDADAIRRIGAIASALSRVPRRVAVEMAVNARAADQALLNRFGGQRAAGGPVDPGRFYLVGEEGPELAMFGQAGTVLPNRHPATQQALRSPGFPGFAGGLNLGMFPGGSLGDKPDSAWDVTQFARSVGGISDKDWERSLRERLSTFRRFSTEWQEAYRELVDFQEEKAEEERRTAEELKEFFEAHYRARQDVFDNQFDEQAISTDAYLAVLEDRHARAVEIFGYWSNEAKAVRDQVRAVRQDIEREAEEARKAAGDAADDARRFADDRLADLNSLLDDEQRIRRQQQELADQHRRRMAEIQASFVADQQSVIDERRKQLADSLNIEERFVVGWANSLGALTRNTQTQIGLFAEWQEELASVRERGVSQAVVDLLGLDEGPQSLAQLRMFASATEQEIADLNAAVAAKNAQATDTAQAEAQQSYSEVGRMLYDLAEKHAAEVEKLTEEFLADQRELSEELASLGLDQGRSYGTAIEAGIRSSIPGIQAAAQAARDAMAGLQEAQQSSVTVQAGTQVRGPDGTMHPIENLASLFGSPQVAGGGWSVPIGSLMPAQQAPVVNVSVQVGNEPVDARVRQTISGMNTSYAIAGSH